MNLVTLSSRVMRMFAMAFVMVFDVGESSTSYSSNRKTRQDAVSP
jgi:hypothetical protein